MDCSDDDSQEGDDSDSNNEGINIQDNGEEGYVNKVLAIRWNEGLWRLEHRVEWQGYENDEYWHPHEDIASYPTEHGEQKYF